MLVRALVFEGRPTVWAIAIQTDFNRSVYLLRRFSKSRFVASFPPCFLLVLLGDLFFPSERRCLTFGCSPCFEHLVFKFRYPFAELSILFPQLPNLNKHSC